jgi:hypothetical protein
MKKVVLGIFVLIMGVACSENDIKGDAVLKVNLTDAPAAYEEVLIDIQDVQYHFTSETDSGSWESLELVNAGVYNLLDFTNGLDTLLAEETLPAGTISQMRLVLGEKRHILKSKTRWQDLYMNYATTLTPHVPSLRPATGNSF